MATQIVKQTWSQRSRVLAVRAAKTFIQGFIAAVSTNVILVGSDFSTTTLRGLLVGAIAAGVSALMNLLIQPQEAK